MYKEIYKIKSYYTIFIFFILQICGGIMKDKILSEQYIWINKYCLNSRKIKNYQKAKNKQGQEKINPPDPVIN
ncbi:MAG: hypothetical protein U5N85_04345 [Arcicella sp.]|nr:hypothetical protein [Arcicella sp.]